MRALNRTQAGVGERPGIATGLHPKDWQVERPKPGTDCLAVTPDIPIRRRGPYQHDAGQSHFPHSEAGPITQVQACESALERGEHRPHRRLKKPHHQRPGIGIQLSERKIQPRDIVLEGRASGIGLHQPHRPAELRQFDKPVPHQWVDERRFSGRPNQQKRPALRPTGGSRHPQQRPEIGIPGCHHPRIRHPCGEILRQPHHPRVEGVGANRERRHAAQAAQKRGKPPAPRVSDACNRGICYYAGTFSHAPFNGQNIPDMKQTPFIAPSILAADFARLGEEVEAVLAAGADVIHFDVMDNHYVPNLTVGPMVLTALRKAGIQATMDVHLMVRPVDALIEAFAEAGADWITFHPEASDHIDRSLALAHSAGLKTGLVFNPATPLNYLDYTLESIDMVLLMSVNPGFGGQSFIPGTLAKLAEVRSRIDASERDIRLEVDGGIKVDNIGAAAAAGADTFVAGTAIFGQPDYAATIAEMRRAIEDAAA